LTYRVELSDRARKDFNCLDRNLQRRIGARIDELAHTPHDSRISGTLTGAGVLRKSRVGGWRIIFTVDDERRVVSLVTIERRGQVYKRL
jgi:mRNA interferase RelE/StbE